MDWLKEFLGDELFSQVEAKLKGNDKVKLANLASGEYVSKSKYDDDIKAKDTKINELAESVKKFDGVDVSKLQQSVKDWETKYAEDMENEKKSSAIKLAVSKTNPKNEKALMALIDTEIIKLNKDGSLTGLQEQLDKAQKEDSYLFETKEPETPQKNVKLGGNHDDGGNKEKTFSLSDAIAEHYEDKGE